MGCLEANSGAFAQFKGKAMTLNHSEQFISAFAFDVIRDALKTIIIDNDIPEIEWKGRAESLVRSFSGHDMVDEQMIHALVGFCRSSFRGKIRPRPKFWEAIEPQLAGCCPNPGLAI